MSTLPTILLIEDDLLTLNLYVRELSRDFDVLACSGMKDVLEMIHTRDLKAIVLEPAALNGKGWELFNTILAVSTGVYSFPIILCSIQDQRKYALNRGATIFLVKPVLPLQLADILHREIEKKYIQMGNKY